MLDPVGRDNNIFRCSFKKFAITKMVKFSLVVLVLAVSTFVQGTPNPPAPYDDIVEAASAGEWDKVQSLITKNFAKDGWKDLSIGGVRDLKPPKGGHVYGESEYVFHSSSNYDGNTSEKSGGHKIINEDGKVAEYDFKPEIGQEDLFKRLGFKPFEQS